MFSKFLALVPKAFADEIKFCANVGSSTSPAIAPKDFACSPIFSKFSLASFAVSLSSKPSIKEPALPINLAVEFIKSFISVISFGKFFIILSISANSLLTFSTFFCKFLTSPSNSSYISINVLYFVFKLSKSVCTF